MQRALIATSGDCDPPSTGSFDAKVIPIRPAFLEPTKRVMAMFEVNSGDFERCHYADAVSCKIVTAAIMLHHFGHGVSVTSDFLSIPIEETTKIEALFKTFFVIRAVPRDMDVGDLARMLKTFLTGKERQLDYRAFRGDAAPVASVSVEPSAEPVPVGRRAPAVAMIMRAVSDYLDVPVSDITSERRGPATVCARRIAMYAARYLTTCSFPMIGRFLGGRDHSTVIYACNTLEAKIGGRPPEGMSLDQLLGYIVQREPAAAELHRLASAREQKRQKAYECHKVRDKTFLEAA